MAQRVEWRGILISWMPRGVAWCGLARRAAREGKPCVALLYRPAPTPGRGRALDFLSRALGRGSGAEGVSWGRDTFDSR